MLFSAVGTCGQRCTSLRRLIVQDGIYDRLVPALIDAYAKIPIGNPLEYEHTVTVGVVSAKKRRVPIGEASSSA